MVLPKKTPDKTARAVLAAKISEVNFLNQAGLPAGG
jgi:hypothetical protein